MSKKRLAAVTVLLATVATIAAVASVTATAKPTTTQSTVKLGFITKFPVDFYFTLVGGAKKWQKTHKNVSVSYAQGKAVIVVSHAMDHVMEVADRAIVMRRGRKVGELVPSAETYTEIVSLIVGGGS